MLTALEAARMIDVSAVRTHNTSSDIAQLVALARKYRFINVHVLPGWVSTLAPMLADLNDVYIGAPVGFPSGGHATQTKVIEALQLVQDGAQEIDIVMNVGRLKDGQKQYVLDELRTIIGMIGDKAITKVIIEINALTDSEMLDACALAINSGAAYVKTGTGWIPGDANIDRIARIKRFCGDKIKVKAAGGIRTREDFLALYDMGVERMGINTKSAVEIVETFA